MTKTEYDALPKPLQFDVRVALACGYTMGSIRALEKYATVLVASPAFADGWRSWKPTTDPTIWTALMDYRDRCHLVPRSVDGEWQACFRNHISVPAPLPTKGEAVCAAFVAAYGRE